MALYEPVGPRVWGNKSAYTKQRMRDWEPYMTSWGGKLGHNFGTSPTTDMREVRGTTWMDMRIAEGWGNWFSKMGSRTWRRWKYNYPSAVFGGGFIWFIWEITIKVEHWYERKKWH
eukprot:TRINITY_DN898_c0_g2_i1.p3 TRINITY_DN898_c0_g2~~TRINITY_DN898_c0_g2_i1.p3  ORF type:complete len:116 (+),score=49.11 TRINITY_DN898_c0_g2_i1:101-448(+)